MLRWVAVLVRSSLSSARARFAPGLDPKKGGGGGGTINRQGAKNSLRCSFQASPTSNIASHLINSCSCPTGKECVMSAQVVH